METTWVPANEVERAMLRALRADDERAYFQALAGAKLYLPASMEARRTGQPPGLLTSRIGDMRCVLVFTSTEALATTAGGHADAYNVTTYADLARNWPDPDLRLAVDPDLPIGAYLTIDDIAKGTDGRADLLSAEELLDEAADDAFNPANTVEELMAEALADEAFKGEANTALFLDALVPAKVLVPTERPVLDPADIDRPGFPWKLYARDPVPTIAVFTSPERLAEGWPDAAPTALVPLVKVARAWPDGSYRLLVNPDSPIEIAFAGTDMVDLVSWGHEMLERYHEPDPSDPPDPVPTGDGKIVHDGVVRSGRAAAAAADRRPAARPELVRLQKVVPHADVERYLRGGYDLVTGFVYPYELLGRHRTPAALYSALGLLQDGTAFQDKDAEVHVIRWYAHCPALYRLTQGGQDEAERSRRGGWMVEPAPFTGTGTAPGDATVPELKVDSVALPHGAQLVKLTHTGRETVVASYDADFRSWLPAAPGDLRAMAGGR